MLGGGPLMPVHWGTFDLGLHPWDEPAETLARHARARSIQLVTPRLGRPLDVQPSLIDTFDPWWREVAPEPMSAERERERDRDLETAR